MDDPNAALRPGRARSLRASSGQAPAAVAIWSGARVASVLLLAVASMACGKRDPAPEAPVVDAVDLLPRASGSILVSVPVGGIERISLPSLASERPRPPGPERLPIHALAGPAEAGSIAFVENDMLHKRHRLLILESDGTERVVFDREGDALWDGAAGSRLALDSLGRRVAIVARTQGVQLSSPPAYLMEGRLEVWDVASRERLGPDTPALDDSLAWFPDGRRLVYTALVLREQAERLRQDLPQEQREFGGATVAWARSPAVHVLDLESGTSIALQLGEQPVLSRDGRLLLTTDFDRRWRLVDLETKESRLVAAPGATYQGFIDFVDSELVLYWASRPPGAAALVTRNNSPLVGAKPMLAVRLFDLRLGTSQQVLPAIDPRTRISFGQQ